MMHSLHRITDIFHMIVFLMSQPKILAHTTHALIKTKAIPMPIALFQGILMSSQLILPLLFLMGSMLLTPTKLALMFLFLL